MGALWALAERYEMNKEVWTEERVEILKAFLEVEQSYCNNREHEKFNELRGACEDCLSELCEHIEGLAARNGDDLGEVLAEFKRETASRLEQQEQYKSLRGGKKEALYEAEIFPKIEEIRALCAEYDIPFFAMLQLDDDLEAEQEAHYMVSSAYATKDACTAFDYVGFMLRHGPDALVAKVMQAKVRSAAAALLGGVEGREESEDEDVPSFVVPFVGEG